MQFKLWCLPILLLINFSNGAGFMSDRDGMYVSTQAEEEKRYKENPNPQKKYRVTINIENAPGEFKVTSASTGFQALNCQYLKKGFAGATGEPRHSISFDLKKISDTQYQGEFYADGMLDEDYGYGYKEKKICHWTLISIGMSFSANSEEDNTYFSASISAKDFDKKNFEVSHFKKEYPKIDNKGWINVSDGINKKAFNPEEYFTFYINLEEVK